MLVKVLWRMGMCIARAGLDWQRNFAAHAAGLVIRGTVLRCRLCCIPPLSALQPSASSARCARQDCAQVHCAAPPTHKHARKPRKNPWVYPSSRWNQSQRTVAYLCRRKQVCELAIWVIVATSTSSGGCPRASVA